MKEVWRPSWLDPWMSRAETDYNVENWPAYRRVAAIVQGNHWATITPPTQGTARLSADQLFRYTVMQAAAATEGPGVAWAASPYADGSFERGVGEAFEELAQRIAPIRESLQRVYPSMSYPIEEGATLATLPHGIVATRSIDDSFEYLHVLNPPASKELILPPPADGKAFGSAQNLETGAMIDRHQTREHLVLKLADGDNWDRLDTVIRLSVEVDPQSNPPANLALHRPVICSTSIEGSLSHKSEWGRIHLVDGQTHATPAPAAWSCGNSGWSSARLPSDHEEWVGVDLGSTHKISSVTLHPRDDGDNSGYGFPVDFTIDVSADGKTWRSVYSHKDSPRPLNLQAITFPPTEARFVRVFGHKLRSNPRDGNLFAMQLVELQVR
jgi:hypothetical protein